MFIPDDYGHVLAKITLAGDPQPLAVTFGVDLTLGSQDQARADTLSGHTASMLKGIMSSVYTYDGLDLAIGQTSGDPIHFSSTNGAGAGTAAATAVPQNTAYLVKKQTAFGGRANRGRMYVPGVTEAAVDTVGTLTGTQVTAVNTILSTFRTALAGSSPLVILHSSAGPTPTPVTSLTVDTRVASQRRRLR